MVSAIASDVPANYYKGESRKLCMFGSSALHRVRGSGRVPPTYVQIRTRPASSLHRKGHLEQEEHAAFGKTLDRQIGRAPTSSTRVTHDGIDCPSISCLLYTSDAADERSSVD